MSSFERGGQLTRFRKIREVVQATKNRFRERLKTGFVSLTITAAFFGVPPVIAMVLLARPFGMAAWPIIGLAFAGRLCRFTLLAYFGEAFSEFSRFRTCSSPDVPRIPSGVIRGQYRGLELPEHDPVARSGVRRRRTLNARMTPIAVGKSGPPIDARPCAAQWDLAHRERDGCQTSSTRTTLVSKFSKTIPNSLSAKDQRFAMLDQQLVSFPVSLNQLRKCTIIEDIIVLMISMSEVPEVIGPLEHGRHVFGLPVNGSRNKRRIRSSATIRV